MSLTSYQGTPVAGTTHDRLPYQLRSRELTNHREKGIAKWPLKLVFAVLGERCEKSL